MGTDQLTQEEVSLLKAALLRLAWIDEEDILPEPLGCYTGVKGKSRVFSFQLKHCQTNRMFVAKFDEKARAQREWQKVGELKRRMAGQAAVLPVNDSRDGVFIYPHASEYAAGCEMFTLQDLLRHRLKVNDGACCEDSVVQMHKKLRSFHLEHAENRAVDWVKWFPRIDKACLELFRGFCERYKSDPSPVMPIQQLLNGKEVSDLPQRCLHGWIHGDPNLTNVLMALNSSGGIDQAVLIDVADVVDGAPCVLDAARVECEIWIEVMGDTLESSEHDPLASSFRLAMAVLNGVAAALPPMEEPYFWPNMVYLMARSRAEAIEHLYTDQPLGARHYLAALYLSFMQALSYDTVKTSPVKTLIACLGVEACWRYLVDWKAGKYNDSQFSLPRKPADVLCYSQGVKGPLSPEKIQLIELKKELEQVSAEHLQCLRNGCPPEMQWEYLDRIAALKKQVKRGVSVITKGLTLCQRFELRDKIGAGHYGEVWCAVDLTERQVVAVKILRSLWNHHQGKRERFFRGVRAMRQLEGVVPILFPHNDEELYHEVEEGHRIYFFVMPYLIGGNLRDRVQDLGPSKCLKIIVQVAKTMRRVHAKGHIHRDIKPENILLDEYDEPKLTDFDLVWIDHESRDYRNTILGTFHYIAPEAFERGHQAAVTDDIYALGKTALFVLQPEMEYLDGLVLLHNILSQHWNNEIKLWLMKALEIDLGTRFCSMQAFVQDLENLLRAVELTNEPLAWIEHQLSLRELVDYKKNHIQFSILKQHYSMQSLWLHEVDTRLGEISTSAIRSMEHARQKRYEKIYPLLERVPTIVEGLSSSTSKLVRFPEIKIDDFAFSLAAVLDEVMVYHGPILEQFDIRPERKGAFDLPIHCDSRLLYFVFSSLINNATESMRCQVENEARVLTFDVAQVEDKLLCKVVDSGLGVLAEVAARIFDDGFSRHPDRSRPSSKNRHQGVGLTESRKLLRSIGGDLYHDKGYSGGACFVVVLPAHSSQS